MNGHHAAIETKDNAAKFVRSPLLNAVTAKDLSLIEVMIGDGIDIFQESGPEQRSAMMEAIILETLPIIDLLLENGEDANRVYGSDGLTAYHYAIMEETWASLAHLVRRCGYPVTDDGGYSPLELATSMCYWRAVSILEQERDNPGFWKLCENAVYGNVQKRLGRIRKPLDDSREMTIARTKWTEDLYEFEGLASSRVFLESIGWHTRDIDSLKRSVYCCSSRAQIIERRAKRLLETQPV